MKKIFRVLYLWKTLFKFYQNRSKIRLKCWIRIRIQIRIQSMRIRNTVWWLPVLFKLVTDWVVNWPGNDTGNKKKPEILSLPVCWMFFWEYLYDRFSCYFVFFCLHDALESVPERKSGFPPIYPYRTYICTGSAIIKERKNAPIMV
jgi:hypothetical protein